MWVPSTQETILLSLCVEILSLQEFLTQQIVLEPSCAVQWGSHPFSSSSAREQQLELGHSLALLSLPGPAGAFWWSSRRGRAWNNHGDQTRAGVNPFPCGGTKMWLFIFKPLIAVWEWSHCCTCSSFAHTMLFHTQTWSWEFIKSLLKNTIAIFSYKVK